MRQRSDQGLAADELPEVGVQAPELLLNGEDAAGVVDRRLDLEPVADDARVAEQPLDVGRPEARDRAGVEACERAAVALALPQDRRPGEARLRAFSVSISNRCAVVV